MGKAQKIERALFVAMILLMTAAIAGINLFHYTQGLNADIASEVVLAKLIHDSGEWIPDSWYVATEARLFQMPNLSALIYGLFGEWIFSAGLACVLLTLGILGSAYYLAVSLRLAPITRALFLALCLILPGSSSILELIYLRACYYAVHTMALFLTLGIYVRALQGHFRPGSAALAVLLEFLLGLQGVRGILVVAGPLLAVEFLRQSCLWRRRKKRGKQDVYPLLFSMLLMAAGFLGGLFPLSVGQSFSRNIRKAPEKLFSQVLPDMLAAIGLKEAWGGAEMLLLLLAYGFLLLLGLVFTVKILRGAELAPSAWGFMVLLISPLAAGVILTFTTVESSGRYFYVFVFAAALGLALLWEKSGERLRLLLTGACLFLFLFRMNDVYLPVLNSPEPSDNEYTQIIRYLEDEGYEQGYTTFAHANTLTVISGGRLRIAAVDDVSRMNIFKWLTSPDWYVPNVPFEQKTAYIVSSYYLEDFLLFYEEHRDTVYEETQIGDFYLFGSGYNYSNLGD